MKSLLVLPRLQIENANAIAGLTWGFPAVSHFLGFSHALSRDLYQWCGQTFDGCAIICHHHQVHTVQDGYGSHSFCLTRNPSRDRPSPDGSPKPASFNEEGRMHLEVTLMLSANFTQRHLTRTFPELASKKLAEEALVKKCQHWLSHRCLAGGVITNDPQYFQPQWHILPTDSADQAKTREILAATLPGFALVDRSDYLGQHHQTRLAQDPSAELMDSWLDFYHLRYQPESRDPSADKVEWHHQPKPAGGYLVPLMVGYQAISPLYEPGQIAHSRDPNTPFCFVESAYGLGEWLSPHRIDNLDQLIWRSHYQDGLYRCFTPQPTHD